MIKEKLSFVVPVNKEQVLSDNVLSSKIAREGRHQFIFQRGYNNVSRAFNAALPQVDNEIIVFCHQDVFLADTWEDEFYDSLHAVNALDPNWGVLGIGGAKLIRRWFGTKVGIRYVGNFSLNVAGGAHVIDYHNPKQYPQQVQTLDECLFVVRKENATFDEAIPNNHFYAVDLCLHCANKGMKSYAISAYIHHNMASKWVFSDFYESAEYMYKKYRHALPIVTPCIVIEDKQGTAKFSTDFVGMAEMTLSSALKFPKRATRRNRPPYGKPKA